MPRAARARCSAVEAPAAPKAESAPAAAKTGRSRACGERQSQPLNRELPRPRRKAAAAKQPSSAQISAIRSACRSDYPKVCAGVPTGGAPALQCLEKNKAKLSASLREGRRRGERRRRGNRRRRRGARGWRGSGCRRRRCRCGRARVIVLRPMRPREELFVLRSACGGDVRALCGGVAPGGGRIVQCLATNAAQLSPACQDVLSQFTAQ